MYIFFTFKSRKKKDLKVDLDRGKMPILMIFLDFCNLTYTLLLSRVRFLKHLCVPYLPVALESAENDSKHI